MHVARPRISHNLSLATDSTSTSGTSPRLSLSAPPRHPADDRLSSSFLTAMILQASRCSNTCMVRSMPSLNTSSMQSQYVQRHYALYTRRLLHHHSPASLVRGANTHLIARCPKPNQLAFHPFYSKLTEAGYVVVARARRCGSGAVRRCSPCCGNRPNRVPLPLWCGLVVVVVLIVIGHRYTTHTLFPSSCCLAPRSLHCHRPLVVFAPTQTPRHLAHPRRPPRVRLRASPP